MNTAVMTDCAVAGEIDPVEEIRLRVWARKNYTPMHDRDESWHPIILDEMLRKDSEAQLVEAV